MGLDEDYRIQSTEMIEECFGGFHRCCLEEPFHLDYVSQDLCHTLGYTVDEIQEVFQGKYSQMIYEEDRLAFHHYLERLSKEEQTLTMQYRIQRKDGRILRVYDTSTSRRMEDNKMYCFSVIADVRNAMRENDGVQQPVATSGIPYGLLHCTCEKYPKVTQINKQMKEYLGITKDTTEWESLIKNNVFFMVPLLQREAFRNNLDDATKSDTPIFVEHTLLRSDGTSISLNGLLSVSENQVGDQEFSLIYLQMDHYREGNQPLWHDSYFSALESAYNVIFEVDLKASTVECIHGKETSGIGSLYDVHMTVDSAKKFWLSHYIVEEDRPMMQSFFDRAGTLPLDWGDKKTLQAEFRMRWIDQITYRLMVVCMQLDTTTVLLCIRDISNVKYIGIKDRESEVLHSLCNWMDVIFSPNEQGLGMLLLEERDGKYTVLYAKSDFWKELSPGVSTQSLLMSGDVSLSQLLSGTKLSTSDFAELLTNNQLYLSPDVAPGGQQIRLTNATYTREGRKLYVIQASSSSVSDRSSAAVPSTQDISWRIFARTFGHFDLFVDGVPITFSSAKEKELLALLIDRNGGTLSTNEAISFLWEDEPVDERVSARYRKLAMGLKKTLTKYGAEQIIINNKGIRSIDKGTLKCDYYELLAGNRKFINSFHNAYMTDYSWGEETLSNLWNYADSASKE